MGLHPILEQAKWWGAANGIACSSGWNFNHISFRNFDTNCEILIGSATNASDAPTWDNGYMQQLTSAFWPSGEPVRTHTRFNFVFVFTTPSSNLRKLCPGAIARRSTSNLQAVVLDPLLAQSTSSGIYS